MFAKGPPAALVCFSVSIELKLRKWQSFYFFVPVTVYCTPKSKRTSDGSAYLNCSDVHFDDDSERREKLRLYWFCFCMGNELKDEAGREREVLSPPFASMKHARTAQHNTNVGNIEIIVHSNMKQTNMFSLLRSMTITISILLPRSKEK